METLIASGLFCFFLPLFPQLVELYFLCFLLFSDVPRNHHPHFLQISHHYCVLNVHLPQCLASGMKWDLKREIILVIGQDFNHQEEISSDQGHQGSMREMHMKMTPFHLVTKMHGEPGQSVEVKFRDERWQKTHLPATSQL